MPIYEYQCAKCNRVLNFLVRTIADHKPPKCPKCGHARMNRQMSSFAPASGEREPAGAPDGLTIPDISGLEAPDQNDPRSMGKFMRQVEKRTRQPLSGDINEITRRLEAGEDPKRIEEDMGGVPIDGAGAGGGGDSDSTLYDG